jgi:hypothetical protein
LTTDQLAPGPLDTGPNRRAWRWPPGEVPVFAVALLARMVPALAGAGFGGLYRYDPGVYYAAGTALGFGRLPYTDFVFLHPPAILLVLSPFGWLGRATSDHAGFVTASVGFMILGAVNAVLVMRIARRMRLGARPATLGGVFYALWPGALAAEWELRLEAFGNFCVLVGLLAWFAARDSMNRRPMLLSGIALGVAAVVKIWFVVPLLILLGASTLRRPGRGIGVFAAGAAGAMIAIAAPFFFLSPNAMWQMTIVQQLGRPASQRPYTDRLGDLTGVHRIAPHLGSTASAACYLVAGLLFAAVLVLAWHIAAARLLVVLALVQLVVLLVVPSWFDFYADFLAPAAALCVAAAAARAPAHAAWGWTAWAERLRRFGWLPATLVAVVSVLALVFVKGDETVPFPTTQLAAAVANRACVQSDSPTALIELNALSRGLRVGCQNWVDITGRTYGVDAPADGTGRVGDATWQRDLLTYLESGDAVILLRPHHTGISRATMRALRRPGVLVRDGRYTVYRTGLP